MRLRTDIFVSALVRSAFGRGDFAAVEHKGAEAAGAVFIRQRFRDGLETLYAPAPQSFFDGEGDGERLFEIRIERGEAAAVREFLDRELRFDSDMWVVELESDGIADIIPIAQEPKGSP